MAMVKEMKQELFYTKRIQLMKLYKVMTYTYGSVSIPVVVI